MVGDILMTLNIGLKTGSPREAALAVARIVTIRQTCRAFNFGESDEFKDKGT